MAGENRVDLCQQCKNVCSCRIAADISLTDPAPLRFPSGGTKKHSARFYQDGQRGTIPDTARLQARHRKGPGESRQRRHEEMPGGSRPAHARTVGGRIVLLPQPCDALPTFMAAPPGWDRSRLARLRGRLSGSGKPHRGPPVEETERARLHEMKVQGPLTWDRP